MHHRIRKIVPVVVLVGVVTAVLMYLYSVSGAEEVDALQASGTVEAVEVIVAPEMAGRITEILAEEGDLVQAGDVLFRLEDDIMLAQRSRAEAALRTAQAQLAQVRAGATPEDMAAAEAVVAAARGSVAVAEAALTQAQINADSARAAEGAAESAVSVAETAVTQAEAAVNIAEANLTQAEALRDRLELGATAEEVAVMASLVAQAEAELALLDVQMEKLVVATAVAGIVMVRNIEPGETVQPGAVAFVIGQLDELTITVFVSEARYGQIRLGQEARVTADSFPGEVFTATVTRIADEAEFTPRNVQTESGRRTTVFAVKLTVAGNGGKLKPGMPADVAFVEAGQ
ncbi:MAG: HlyD family efflux transporter periplasmic adaptor subunit [Anaerolineales bacterium]|nr:HlyD family efflux transporter periplasmic adaptor subunit [Anaerolineales bacterium]MCB8983651.1 HlyD family efflux transporter periplasmic adaptor subunit [Ardenticatenaceae bacterium]